MGKALEKGLGCIFRSGMELYCFKCVMLIAIGTILVMIVNLRVPSRAVLE